MFGVGTIKVSFKMIFLRVGLKSNRSFCDFPYYGKNNKIQILSHRKRKKKKTVRFSGEQRERERERGQAYIERGHAYREREREREGRLT
jgi:hypothetical protein